ncbi:MAG: 3-deoxy-D-manno-octulosonic acid transferase [Kiritimatiellia bacterium]
MKWFLYNLLFSIAYVLMMPKFLFRMIRRGGYVNRFSDRFGYYPVCILERLKEKRKRFWIHAVSVGEVAVAGQLMRELRLQCPSLSFILSTTSSTGWTQAEKIIGTNDILIHNPLDYPGCVRRALSILNPLAYIIIETELWPNMIRLAQAREIPIFLVNARISDHSAPGYRRLRCWFGPVLNRMNRLYVQSDLDARRLMDAGCASERMTVTGSMKFDVAHRTPEKEAELRAYLTAAGFAPDAQILLGGSTWPGEDAFLLDVYRQARITNSNLRLILAPRHFEKASDVEASIVAAGFTCLRKSRVSKPTPALDDSVLLADTTGELMGFYGLAQTVFVGKSLCEHGAQNMIEPCLCGCATVIGPYTENFRPVMSDLLEQKAIVQAKDRQELKLKLLTLLSDETARKTLGTAAIAAVQKRCGITPNIVTDILHRTSMK